MDQMRRGAEHPPSEKLNPSKDELDSIDDLEPEQREADAVKGGDGSPGVNVTLSVRKAGGDPSSAGKEFLRF